MAYHAAVRPHRVALAALLACGARTGLEVSTPADASLSDVFSGDASDAPVARACPIDRRTVLVGDAGFGEGALVLDDGSIYWVSWNPIGIETVPKTGGAAAVVLSGLSGPVGLTASSGYVFWTDFNSNEVGRVSTDGGDPIVLAKNQSGAQGVAVADEVYWTTWKTGTMDRVSIDGGTAQALSNSTIANYAEITTDGQHVFWATSRGPSTGSIMAYSFATQTVSVVATAAKGGPFAITTDGVNVYWEEIDPSGVLYIVRANVNGGASTVLASVAPDDAGLCYANTNCQGEVATDGQHVYFTVDGDAGAVLKVPVGGGAPIVVAQHEHQPWGIAVDDACVYWHTWDAVVVSPK